MKYFSTLYMSVNRLFERKDARDERVVILLLLPLIWLAWLTVDHLSDSMPQPEVSETKRKLQTGGESWDIGQLRVLSDGGLADPAQQEVLVSLFQMRKIPVNLAAADLLQTVPGIGPALSERIIAERLARGPFESAEDLMRVAGIGPGRAGQFQQYLRFD